VETLSADRYRWVDPHMRRRLVAPWLFGVILVLLAPRAAHAQSTGTPAIVGVVRDRNNAPVADAVVDVLSVGRARTDSAGAFRIGPVPPGTLIVRATRIGYQPVMKMLTIASGEERRLDIAMSPATQQLPMVVVREDSTTTLLADPTGFDARRKTAVGGHFILEQEIAKKHITETEQLFHGIPTVQVDTGGIVVIKRGEISLRDIYGSGGDQFFHCIGAQVIVNGVEMPQPFNINLVAPGDIRGIEIYSGPATTPTRLRSPKTVCGTVAIWTKQT
jgi:hypothetical protein